MKGNNLCDEPLHFSLDRSSLDRYKGINKNADEDKQMFYDTGKTVQHKITQEFGVVISKKNGAVTVRHADGEKSTWSLGRIKPA